MWGVSLTGVPFNTTINSNNVDVIYPSIYGSVTKNKSQVAILDWCLAT